MTEEEIDVQAAFVGFIHDDAVIFGQRGVALGLGEEDAVGHQFDAGLRIGAVVEPDFAADLPTPAHVQFLGDAAGDSEGCDAARLGAADGGFDAEPRLEAHFGNLGGFAGAGFTGDDDHLMSPDGVHDIVLARGDGKVGRIADGRGIEPALLTQCDGSGDLLVNAIENLVMRVRMMFIAQEPNHPTAKPHPVGQHGLRQEFSDGFDPFGRHVRPSSIADGSEAENLPDKNLQLACAQARRAGTGTFTAN